MYLSGPWITHQSLLIKSSGHKKRHKDGPQSGPIHVPLTRSIQSPKVDSTFHRPLDPDNFNDTCLAYASSSFTLARTVTLFLQIGKNPKTPEPADIII